MRENKEKIIIGLLILNMILVLYFGIKIRKDYKFLNQRLGREVVSINNGIRNIEHSLSNRVENLLNNQKDRVSEATYSYLNIDSKNLIASLSFSICLKEVSPGGEVYLVYNVAQEPKTEEVLLQHAEGLTYKTQINLGLDKNYEYSLIEKTSDGGMKQLNTHKLNILLANEFYDQRVQMHEASGSYDDKSIEQSISFSVDNLGIETFSLKDVKLELFYEGKLLESKTVTGNLISSKNGDYVERYNVALASRQIDESTTLQEFVDSQGLQDKSESGNLNKTFYTHKFKIDNKHYPELNLNHGNADQIEFRYTVECIDGYVYEMH